MFTKFLIPTDGSPLSHQAALEGISLAKKVGAEVIGIFVARESQNPAFDFVEVHPKNQPTPEEYKAAVMKAGEDILKPLREAAAAEGVRFSEQIFINNATAHQINTAANDSNCNLIFMGSNGCAGWTSMLMGSVAAKVLSTSQVPVLVYKVKKEEIPVKAKMHVTVIPMP